MNTNAVLVVVLLALACGLVGMSSQAHLTENPDQRGVDEPVDDDVSVFMQRGVVAVNGSVDAGMWLAAFETAGNLSRKQALVRQRAVTLEARLDQLEARTQRFPPANATPLALRAQRARLVAERDALRTAISATKTTAAGEGVNATTLDELDHRVENLTVPTIASNNSTATGTVTASDNPSVTGTPSVNRTETRFAENRRSGATYSGP